MLLALLLIVWLVPVAMLIGAALRNLPVERILSSETALHMILSFAWPIAFVLWPLVVGDDNSVA